MKNSWGTSWGASGYFYVSYYDAQIGRDNTVFTAEATTNYNRVYEYDTLGNLTKITDLNGQAWTFAYSPLGRLQSATDPLKQT